MKQLAILAAGFVLTGAAAPPPPSVYAAGLQMIHARDFRGARAELIRVTRSGCDAVALYLLGHVHSKLIEPQETIRVLERSNGCNPRLPERYRISYRQMWEWATARLRPVRPASEGFRMGPRIDRNILDVLERSMMLERSGSGAGGSRFTNALPNGGYTPPIGGGYGPQLGTRLRDTAGLAGTQVIELDQLTVSDDPPDIVLPEE